MPLACICEGHGEVEALPVLLDRLSRWLTPDRYTPLARPPIRVARDRFLNRRAEFERFLRMAANKATPNGAVLVLLDADDDCPVNLAADLSNRASTVVPDVPVCIVLADREYEAWFLASAPELDGTGGFDAARWNGEDPDAPRDAKKRVAECLGRKYSEVLDQPSLTARMDLEAAYARSRSFRKLCTDWSGRLA